MAEQPGYAEIIDNGKNYEAHSHKLNCQSYRFIWDRIRDCYEGYLNKCHFNAAHMAWEFLASVMNAYRTMRQHEATLFADGYVKPIIPAMPVELAFVDTMPDESAREEGVEYCLRDPDDPTGHTFFAPERFRMIYSLTDFINSPTVYLYADNHYAFYAYNRSGRQGRIVFSADTVWASSMWALLYSEKRVEEIIGRFGPLVEYFDLTHDEQDTIDRIYGLMRVQQGGPVANLLELGISIINDWPFTTERCTVIDIADDNSWLIVDPMLEGRRPYQIDNTTGLAFKVRNDDWTWSDVGVRTVLEPWRALTRAAEVHDLVSLPDLCRHFSVSALASHHTMVVEMDGNLPCEPARMAYYNAMGPMTPGATITGAASGATAEVVDEEYDPDTATGTLQLDNVLRNFYYDEIIDNGLGVTAKAAGPATQRYDVVDPTPLILRNKKSTALYLIVYHLRWTPQIEGVMTSMGADVPARPETDIATSAFDFPATPEVEMATGAFARPGTPEMEAPYTTLYGSDLDTPGVPAMATDYN